MTSCIKLEVLFQNSGRSTRVVQLNSSFRRRSPQQPASSVDYAHRQRSTLSKHVSRPRIYLPHGNLHGQILCDADGLSAKTVQNLRQSNQRPIPYLAKIVGQTEEDAKPEAVSHRRVVWLETVSKRKDQSHAHCLQRHCSTKLEYK